MAKIVQFNDTTGDLNPKTVSSAIKVESNNDTLDNVLSSMNSNINNLTSNLSSIQTKADQNATSISDLQTMLGVMPIDGGTFADTNTSLVADGGTF
jgi:hypothetical protein